VAGNRIGVLALVGGALVVAAAGVAVAVGATSGGHSSTATRAPVTVAADNLLTEQQISSRYSADVVTIIAASPGRRSPARTVGSGFVITKDGLILTNAHLVTRHGVVLKEVQVVFGRGTLQSTRVVGTVVCADSVRDVAAVRIDPAKSPPLTPLPLGDSSTLQSGQRLIVLAGSGERARSTSAVISATNVSFIAPGGATIEGGIHTDATLGKVGSGGPLIDQGGRVVGVTEQVNAPPASASGGSFALPIESTARVIADSTGG
jgi:S1-C subfamily serine protease